MYIITIQQSLLVNKSKGYIIIIAPISVQFGSVKVLRLCFREVVGTDVEQAHGVCKTCVLFITTHMQNQISLIQYPFFFAKVHCKLRAIFNVLRPNGFNWICDIIICCTPNARRSKEAIRAESLIINFNLIV